jgi:hypothetical protein
MMTMLNVALRRLARNAMAMAFVLLLALLTACGQAPTPEPTPEPTHTPQPTFTPIPSPTATPTVTMTPTPTSTPTITPTPTPDPNLNPLTGLRVDDLALINRRVLAVRIGNDPIIRPQDGLGLAEIVYEEVMDGWTVTRFTALYLASEPERIRPIRSARLSGLAIAPQYDAAYVHTGASDRTRWLISQATDFQDLDQWFHPQPYALLAGYDWRGRIFTSVDRVRDYLEQRGFEHDAPPKGYTFDPTPPVGEPATQIHIPYPQSSVVDWAYDAATGRYLRFVQGRPHIESLTGEQIAADNVIVFYAEHRRTDIVEDVFGATAIDIVMSGSGRALVIRDGVAVEARWMEGAPGEPIQYYDADGNIVPLRPGHTWIQLVPTDYQVVVE